MQNKPQNFWNFSLDLYDREGVASACLELQEEYRLDVNLILLCYWHGSYFGVISEQLLSDAIAFSTEWRRHVVQPLRNTRSWMKLHADPAEQFDELRERIKAIELTAEGYQQERIAQLVFDSQSATQGQSDGEAIATNIDKFLQVMELDRDRGITERLQIISIALEQRSLLEL